MHTNVYALKKLPKPMERDIKHKRMTGIYSVYMHVGIAFKMCMELMHDGEILDHMHAGYKNNLGLNMI